MTAGVSDHRLIRAAIVVVVLGVGGLGVLAYEIHRSLSSTIIEVSAQKQLLEKAKQHLQAEMDVVNGQFHTLQEQQAELKEAHEGLKVDRDNLLAQITRIREERDQAVAEGNVLGTLLKRMSAERLQFKETLDPLQGQYALLQQNYAAAVKEMDGLTDKLTKAKKRSREKQLQEALNQEKRERKQLGISLRHIQQHIKTTEARRAKDQMELVKIQSRLETLKDQYTHLLAENTAMELQVKRAPADVSRLARQHEKLIKENADMHYNLGVLFSQNKEYPRALTEFRKVLELRPDDADAHYNIGVIYAEHVRDRDKALSYFRRYLKLNPRAHDASWVKHYIASWQAWEGKERLE